MTTMEKLVEAYLEKERVINEQVQMIMKLQSEISNLESKLEKEKEANRWSKEIAYKFLYGKTITAADREKGEKFKSRLLGYQTPEYRKFTDPPAPLKFDPDKAEEIDKKLKETLG